MTRLTTRLDHGRPDADVLAALDALRADEKKGRGKNGRPAAPRRAPWTRIVSNQDGTVDVIVSDEDDPAAPE